MKAQWLLTLTMVALMAIAGAALNRPTTTQSGSQASAADRAIVTSDGVPLVGNWAYLKSDASGCRALDELDRLKEFASERDKPAFTRYFTDHCEPGLPADTKVMVEDYSIWHSALCVRPSGSAEKCVWTPDQGVETRP